MNNDDISHFSTIPASFAIKSNVYIITHQYLIINNSQSQRALSVSVHTDETVVFYLYVLQLQILETQTELARVRCDQLLRVSRVDIFVSDASATFIKISYLLKIRKKVLQI